MLNHPRLTNYFRHKMKTIITQLILPAFYMFYLKHTLVSNIVQSLADVSQRPK